MNIICNGRSFEIDSILLTSKMILRLNENFGVTSINVPDEYYNIFSEGITLKKSNNFLLLKLYDFLDVNPKYVIELSKEIGIFLESSKMKMHIEEYLLEIIVKNYRS